MVVENLQITPLMEWLLGAGWHDGLLWQPLGIVLLVVLLVGGGLALLFALRRSSAAPGPAVVACDRRHFRGHVAAGAGRRGPVLHGDHAEFADRLHRRPVVQGPDAAVGFQLVQRRAVYVAWRGDRPDGRGLCRAAGWPRSWWAGRWRARGNAAGPWSKLPSTLPAFRPAAFSPWRGWRSASRSAAAWWWSSWCSWS